MGSLWNCPRFHLEPSCGTRPQGPTSAACPETGSPNRNGRTMLDITFIALGLAFFGLAAGYAALCERL